MVEQPLLRITKKFSFEMAHAITGYPGKCSQIHGHSYKMRVTIIGKISDKDSGMVIDFKILKDLITDTIITPYDHKFVIEDTGEGREVAVQMEKIGQKVSLCPFPPTTENLLIHFVNKIKTVLPEHIHLHSVLLQETDNSYAEWYHEDQL